MTEQGFWEFLEQLWKKGRAQQLTVTVDCGNPQVQAYLQGHALLPKDYDKLNPQDIIKAGNLLFRKDASPKSKEAVMVLLAHQRSEIALTILTKYCFTPDKALECFARLALDECAMWNE